MTFKFSDWMLVHVACTQCMMLTKQECMRRAGRLTPFCRAYSHSSMTQRPAVKILLKKQGLFPLTFIPHRWVENVPLLERALAMWEHLRHYTEAVSDHRLPLPKYRAYENVSAFLKDQLALAKLNFSLNVTMVVQPFLTLFQSDSPNTFF